MVQKGGGGAILQYRVQHLGSRDLVSQKNRTRANLWSPSTLPPLLSFAASISFKARAIENQRWAEDSKESWMAYLYKPLGIHLYPVLEFKMYSKHTKGRHLQY